MSTPVEPACSFAPRSPKSWVCVVVWTSSLLVIFGAGAVSGVAGYSYWHHSYMLWLREHPDEIPGMVIEKLTSELGLTAEQVPRVADVVRRNHAELETLQDEIRPRIDMRCADYEDEMQQLLTPAQFAIWLPHFREIRKIWLP